jgi:ComF family protein
MLRMHLSPMQANTFARSHRLSAFLDWLYPPRCRSCRDGILARDEECICTACRSRIRVVGHPRCVMCGRPFPDAAGEDHECAACLTREPHFSKARAWALYPRGESPDDPVRAIVHRFKYGRKISLGKPLGRILAGACHGDFRRDNLDCIVPVPLHPKRLRWRGFNQAVVLGKELSRAWRLPIDPFILVRTRPTVPQTELNEAERRTNVRGAFAVEDGTPVKNKALLLLDDVYTSGATVNECSRVLRRAGAKSVHVLTLARTES